MKGNYETLHKGGRKWKDENRVFHIKCRNCGKEFEWKNPGKRYCSDECYEKSKSIQTERVCKRCKKTFMGTVSKKLCPECMGLNYAKSLDALYQFRADGVIERFRGYDPESFSKNFKVCIILEALAHELKHAVETTDENNLLADYARMIHRTYAGEKLK